MEYALDCDSCDFNRMVDDDQRAYGLAKEHESQHGKHFVLIETIY